MSAAFSRLPELERHVHALSRTESPVEAFQVLRDACRLAAPRGAIFLIRKGKIQGWSAVGYDEATVEAQRAFTCGLHEGWLGRIASSGEVPWARRDPESNDPDFGQPAAAECVGGAIRIQGNPVAAVVLERAADESPWHPESIALLLTVTELRLELDLALRRMKGASAPLARPAATPEPVAAEVEESVPAATEPGPAEDLAAAPEPAPEPAPGVELAPVAVGGLPGVPVLDAARRYARLVATDIRLYNEEAVALGRRNGDLLKRLEEHLDRGRETFLKRHGDLGPEGLELLREAYVQVLAAGDDSLIPSGSVE